MMALLNGAFPGTVHEGEIIQYESMVCFVEFYIIS